MMTFRFMQDRLDLEPTSLRDCPRLAGLAGIRRVLIKDEGERPFGNFKILGGMVAGLRALARETGVSVAEMAAGGCASANLPRLICASDGNHGLAVAAAARLAGARAAIYLHPGVEPERVDRILALGAEIVWVPGTYDDAVAAARSAADRDEGGLVPDTSLDEADPAVREVMDGYALMTDEIAAQLESLDEAPTHLFVQAGVGGLAAAMAEGLWGWMRDPGRVVVVEPETAACVGRALTVGKVERIDGDLRTSAAMLSCGEASAPALAILKRYGAQGMQVDEDHIAEAVRTAAGAGIVTTPSGACGLAGLLQAAGDPLQRKFLGLEEDSVVLLVATERPLGGSCSSSSK